MWIMYNDNSSNIYRYYILNGIKWVSERERESKLIRQCVNANHGWWSIHACIKKRKWWFLIYPDLIWTVVVPLQWQRDEYLFIRHHQIKNDHNEACYNHHGLLMLFCPILLDCLFQIWPWIIIIVHWSTINGH